MNRKGFMAFSLFRVNKWILKGFVGVKQGPPQQCVLIANACCMVSRRQVDSLRTQWVLGSWNRFSHEEGSMQNTTVNSDPIVLTAHLCWAWWRRKAQDSSCTFSPQSFTNPWKHPFSWQHQETKVAVCDSPKIKSKGTFPRASWLQFHREFWMSSRDKCS